jgi:hypothetical protein
MDDDETVVMSAEMASALQLETGIARGKEIGRHETIEAVLQVFGNVKVALLKDARTPGDYARIERLADDCMEVVRRLGHADPASED